MNNPNKGEVGFSCELEFDDDASLDTGRFTLTFKMNNAGRRAMENFLDLEYPEVEAKLRQGILGSRIMTGLFMAATRKHHVREFPTVQSCDEFMDAMDDADDELQVEFNVALLAANARTTAKDMRERLGLDDDSDDGKVPDAPEPDEDSSTEDAERDSEDDETTPKDEKPESSQKGRAASGRGKGSSKKESGAAA